MAIPLKHIVLADDDREDLEFFQDALKDHCPDVEVTTAEDGSDLLSVLNNVSTPDIIVLDLNMPRLSGKDCLKAIRNNHKFKKVPIIVYSTSSSKHDVEECLSYGANHYITKPGSVQAISSLVKKLCNGDILSDSSELKYA